MLCLATGLLSLAARLPYAENLPREVVNFDFAWRYQPAVEPRYRQCVFEHNVSYADPGGDGQIWAGIVTSKEQC